MKVFKYKNETHVCHLKAFIAGGPEKEAERGIYQCKCGIRWEEMLDEEDNK